MSQLTSRKRLSRLAPISVPSFQFWGLFLTLAALFAMGGSSRFDVQSLALLNPITIACCGAALLSMKAVHLAGKMPLLAGMIFAILLVAAYLAPISEQLLNFSGDTGAMTAVRAEADASRVPRILSMAPTITRQSLFFLFAPLAVVLFALQLNGNDLRLSVPLLIAAGAISGITGVLQLAGSSNGPLYFYQVTNNGSAVGLFANRNHAAVFLACLFPMLALVAAKSEGASRGMITPQLLAMAIAIILVPLILVTGSRSGMLTATMGLMGAALLYVSHAPSYRGSGTARAMLLILAALVLVCIVLVTVYFSRAEAIERIFTENVMGNVRADFWNSSLTLFWQHFPVGFGPGGFVQAFQNTEPMVLLDGKYLNRLHNDWLETALTFGVPGIVFMLAGTGYYIHRSYVLWIRMDGAHPTVALSRMACIVISILAVASISDYPLRTPAIAGFTAIVLVWFARAEIRAA